MAESKLRDLSIDFAVKTHILSRETTVDLYNLCGSIRRILISSIKTAKENTK